jgi:hypothetical protein
MKTTFLTSLQLSGTREDRGALQNNEQQLALFGNLDVDPYDATNTDFAILTGAMDDSIYWLANPMPDPDQEEGMAGIASAGFCTYGNPHSRLVATRPVLPKGQHPLTDSFKVKEIFATGNIIEFGEYPQSVVSNRQILKKLESGNSKETGKCYTIDRNYQKAMAVTINGSFCERTSARPEKDIGFEPKKLQEVELNGDRYVKIKANAISPSLDERRYQCLISNEEPIEDGKEYWVKVEPIEWLVDVETDTWVSKMALVAGIRFDKEKVNFNQNPEIKQYLEKYFDKEMLASNQKTIVNENMHWVTVPKKKSTAISTVSKALSLNKSKTSKEEK